MPPLTISPTVVTRTPNFAYAHMNTQYDDYISQPQKFSALDHMCLSMSVSHLKRCVSLALLYPPLFLRHEYVSTALSPEKEEGVRGGVAEVAQLFPLAEFECSLIVELCPLRAHVVKSLDSKMVEPLGCGA